MKIGKGIVLIAAALLGFSVYAESKYYGLFVGINKYSNGVSSLMGCDRDVAVLRDAYTASGFCAETDASSFLDYAATKAAVRARFNELAAEAQSGDTVLYYQSSHGDDYNSGDAADKGACLCMTDDDWLDTEFAEDLAKFSEGVRVVVVIDTCYSGGMFKSAGAESTPAKRKGAWNFARRVNALLSARRAATKKSGAKGIDLANVGWITASDWNELSGASSAGSLFTNALLDGWRNGVADTDGNGRLDFSELAEYAKANVPVDEDDPQTVQSSNDELLSSVVAGNPIDVSTFRMVSMNGTVYCFYGPCPAEVEIPDGTAVIGMSAFDADYNEVGALESVTIPASVTNIADYAFCGCTNLASVTFAGNVEDVEIGRQAFYRTPWGEGHSLSPANDDFENAAEIEGAEGTIEGTNVGATSVVGEPLWDGESEATVWYRWMAPANGTYVFNTIGSDFDTVLGIYTGDAFESLTLVGENDDLGDGWCISRISFDAVTGTVYSIAVGGYEEADGNFALNWYFDDGTFRMIVKDGVVTGFRGDCPAAITADDWPDGVTGIGSYAFSICETLCEVVIPTNVASVSSNAFVRCNGLSRAFLPQTLEGVVDEGAVFPESPVSVYYYEGASPAWVTITLDANGGVADPVTCHVLPDNVFGKLPAPKFSGHIFLGWFTDAEGGDEVTAETVVTGDMTLYAHWGESPFSATGGAAEWGGDADGSWRSGEITHSQTTWVEITVTNAPCVVSFRWKTSSEGGYDTLHCYVDGYEIVSPISGMMANWTNVSFAVTEVGNHTIRFVYTKDYSDSRGDDCGWVTDFTTVPVKTRTLLLDSNDGSGGVSEMQVVDGYAIGQLPELDWAGEGHCRFLGWFTAAEEGEPILADTTVVDALVRIYAHWKEIHPPANDNFADAAEISGASGSVAGTTIDSTREEVDLIPDWDSDVPSTVWYRWTAPSNGVFTFFVQDADLVRDWSCYIAATAGYDAEEFAWTEANIRWGAVSIAATAGEVYWIEIGSYFEDDEYNEEFDFTLSWDICPANDEYENPEVLESTESGSVAGTLLGATITDDDCIWRYGDAERTVWYKWVAPFTGTVRFEATADNGQSGLLYLVATRGYDEEEGKWDDCGYDEGRTVTFNVVEGETYYVSLATWNYVVNGFTLSWQRVLSPDNDAFADAAVISGTSGRVKGTNLGASVEEDEPLPLEEESNDEDSWAFASTATVWWKWTAPLDGSVTFSTKGSDFDTALGVYTGGAVDALEGVAANDEGDDDSTSVVSFDAVAGTTYYIVVGGYENAQGNIVLTWSMVGGAEVFYMVVEDGVVTGFSGECPATIAAEDWPEGVTEIAEWAFEEAEIKSVALPSTLQKIGTSAFAWSSLESVEGLRDDIEVGPRAFAGTPFDRTRPFGFEIEDGVLLGIHGICPETIEIPEAVTNIAESAFDSEEYGYYLDEEGDAQVSTVDALASVSIPASVATIDKWAFYYCTNLTEVGIGNSDIVFEGSAFFGCTNLKSVAIEKVGHTQTGWRLEGYAVLFEYDGEPEWHWNDLVPSGTVVQVELDLTPFTEGVPREDVYTNYYGDVVTNYYNQPFKFTWVSPVWEADSFTIAFDSNGGSAVESIVQDYGTEVESPADPTRTGYTFAGWTPAVPETVPASNVTCVAQWTPNTYTVTFDANGGEGEMADASWTYDAATNLAAVGFTRVGHAFAGWATAPDGAVVFADGAAVSNLTAVADGAVTLYAAWTPNEYTVIFLDRGDEVASTTQDYGTEVTAPADPVRPGYTFTGWTPAAPETVPAEDVTCVAQWTPNTYTVAFDANGGEGEMADASWTYDAATNLAAVGFTHVGHTFAGWATAPDGVVVFADGEAVSNLTAVANGDVALYAQWAPNTYAVAFDANGGEGEMPDQVFTYDLATCLSSNAFTLARHTFIGWATNETGEVVFAEGAEVSNLTAVADGVVALYAQWELEPDESIAGGTYFRKTMAELGFGDLLPAEGTPYAVVATGLPSGLRLMYNAAEKNKKGKVTKKAKVEWWIEGVPSAALDFAANPVYFTFTVGGKSETVALGLDVSAQAVEELPALELGQTLGVEEPYYLPGVTNGWTVSGLPAGLKYAAKLLTAKKKSGKKTVVTTNALPYTVYGKTTKAGLFNVTAKRKVAGTGYYETLKFKVLVNPKGADKSLFGEALTNVTTTAYVQFPQWDLAGSGVGKVAKVTGLPAGIAFSGQKIAGTPTKPGTYVVTFTKNVTSGKKTVAKTAQILWTVLPNEEKPEIDFNTEGGVFESATVGLSYAGLHAFSATAGAKVQATGLPKGMSLTQLGDGRWAITGFTAKTGTYVVTVKATLNGNTVTQRLALNVAGLPAYAKGTYNGFVSGSDGATNGLATVTVSAAGKVSGKFYEGGTNWTLSAESFTGYDPATSNYTAEVTAQYAYKVTIKKKKVTQYVRRSFLLTVAPGGLGGVAELVELNEDGSAKEDGSAVSAWQNLWGSAYKAVGKKLFYTSKKAQYKTWTFKGTADDGRGIGLLETETLSLKVTPNGAVTATLTHDTGKKKKGKKVYYKPTCATVVIPATAPDVAEFQGEAFLFFAPSSANNFTGYIACVPIP